MTRVLYRLLIGLHPPNFRRQFAGEMLWIFDETRERGVTLLLLDGTVSLARQWLIRQGAWKIGVAVLCAGLHMILILGSLSSVARCCP
jgi:hypothetical protein